MEVPNILPCLCSNSICGFKFLAPNQFAGVKGSNNQFTQNKLSCPKCGGIAYFADWGTDSQGNFHLYGFFNSIRKIKNVETINSIKEELDALNDEVTITELMETLVKHDPYFSKFRESIGSLPSNLTFNLKDTIIGILTLLLMLYSIYSDKEDQQENYSMTAKQYELEKEKFEYQKQKDAREDKVKQENIYKRINKLETDFDRKIKQFENRNKKPSSARKKLKGSDRNKLCPCGSGKKAKKCHSNGY